MWVAKIMAYSGIYIVTDLKFFRHSILGDRPVFHYKGLVDDIDRWKCIGRQKVTCCIFVFVTVKELAMPIE